MKKLVSVCLVLLLSCAVLSIFFGSPQNNDDELVLGQKGQVARIEANAVGVGQAQNVYQTFEAPEQTTGGFFFQARKYLEKREDEDTERKRDELQIKTQATVEAYRIDKETQAQIEIAEIAKFGSTRKERGIFFLIIGVTLLFVIFIVSIVSHVTER